MRALRSTVVNVALFQLVLLAAVLLGRALSGDGAEEVGGVGGVVGDVLYYDVYTLPTLALYLLVLRKVAPLRAMAVLLSPLAVVALLAALGSDEDLTAVEALVAALLPTLAYGAVVRLDGRPPGARRRLGGQPPGAIT